MDDCLRERKNAEVNYSRPWFLFFVLAYEDDDGSLTFIFKHLPCNNVKTPIAVKTIKTLNFVLYYKTFKNVRSLNHSTSPFCFYK